MLTISIKKDGNGNLMAVTDDAKLFSFAYRKESKGWLFWIPTRGPYDPARKEGRAFPWDYFIDLCRAVAFLKGEALGTSETTYIVSGKSYVK